MNTQLNKNDIITALAQLNELPPENEYRLIKSNDDDVYYGKDHSGHFVFVIRSEEPKRLPIMKTTGLLVLNTNAHCVFDHKINQEGLTAHVLTCLSINSLDQDAFIRLTAAFLEQSHKNDDVTAFFDSLTRLFKRDDSRDDLTMQGLFGELYAIKHLDSLGIKIYPYWQSQDRMKFDFTIDSRKRMDVKTTTKQDRVHHFRHEQLRLDLYDILIMSIQLRPSDKGVTMLSLVNYTRDLYASDYRRLMIIEEMIKNYSTEELSEMCYDSQILEENIAFFDATDVPRFKEPSPVGVSNAEYDVDLTSSKPMSAESLKTWFKDLSNTDE